MKQSEFLTHVHRTDPSTEWHSGVLGWMARYRGIATWLGGHLSIGGAVTLFSEQQEICWGVGGIGLTGAWALWWIRGIFLRHSRSNICFHEFSHSVRDAVVQALSPKGTNRDFEKVCDIAAQNIASFFRAFKNDSNLSCIIRVANQEGPDAQRRYITLGRSDKLDPSRSNNTEAIPYDKGLVNMLREKCHQGAIIVKSIKGAISDGVYLRTVNDDLEDCGSLVICPINTRESGMTVMIGTVSVQSKHADAFRSADTPPLMGFADLLGLILPVVLAKFAKDDTIAKTGGPPPASGGAQADKPNQKPRRN